MEALQNGLELVVPDVAHQPQFCAAAQPTTDDTLALGEIVAVHQMIRRVPRPFDIARIVSMRGAVA